MNIVISGSPEEGSWVLYFHGSRYQLNQADMVCYLDRLRLGKQLLVHGDRLLFVPHSEIETFANLIEAALRPMTAAKKYGELMYNARGELA